MFWGQFAVSPEFTVEDENEEVKYEAFQTLKGDAWS